MSTSYNVRIHAGDVNVMGHLNTPAARVEAVLQVYIQQWLKGRGPRAPLRLEMGDTTITVSIAKLG